MKSLIVLVQASYPALFSPTSFTKLKTSEKKNRNPYSIFYQRMISEAKLSQWSLSSIPFRDGQRQQQINQGISKLNRKQTRLKKEW